MPLALLLSPDDQAVSAITAVLEEMAVTCERPLDGASAAKQISSHKFDLVLVDCENLPAAKLIFDVCRRGKSGNNPVPIAIVDGRAGLPTAFRLGAELILTKPVAKDQARSTIRTAVSRVKREEPSRQAEPTAPSKEGESDTAQASSLQTAADQTEALLTRYESSTESSGDATPEPRALAATAAAGSSSLPPVSHSSAAAPAPSPEVGAPGTPVLDSSTATNTAATPAATPAEPISSPLMKPSDDPVLAAAEEADAAPQAIFSSYPPKQRKTRRSLVALLALALVAGGFYAAWTYEPGFRAFIQPQIDNLLNLVGSLRQWHAAAPAQVGVKTATRPVSAQVETPANSSQLSQPVDANGSAPTPLTPSDATTASANPASGSTVPLAQPASPAAVTTAIGLGKPGVVASGADKLGANSNAANQNSAANGNPAAHGTLDAELPGEQSAVILSSKGAERRLIHSVQPTFPAEARAGGAEGTVVLRAVVDENGKVAGARVVEGDAALAKVAISAVKQWRYRPYVRDGRTQPFQTIVLVDFQRR